MASHARTGLRRGLVGPDGRPDPQAVKNAFEALLLSELFKPLQESLRESGLFPAGAQGDIYASLWQTQLSELLAADLDLLPGWMPAGASSSSSISSSTTSSMSSATAAPLAAGAHGARSDAAPGLAGRVAAAAAAQARAARPVATRAAAAQPAGRSASVADAPPVPARLAARAGAGTAAGQALASRLAPFEPAIQDAARATGLEANWLRAVIIQESAGRPEAVSRKGAAGLMQLLPATAAALGVRDLFEPAQNVMAGARYLRSLFERYGDPRLALAAYNAGPGRIEAYGGIPPFNETRTYVERVLALKTTFDRLAPGVAAAR